MEERGNCRSAGGQEMKDYGREREMRGRWGRGRMNGKYSGDKTKK